MRVLQTSFIFLAAWGASGSVIERQSKGGFEDGQPIDGNGKGAPFSGIVHYRYRRYSEPSY